MTSTKKFPFPKISSYSMKAFFAAAKLPLTRAPATSPLRLPESPISPSACCRRRALSMRGRW